MLVNAVSVWEAAAKSVLGKLRVPDDLPRRLDEFAFERLPVTEVHAWAVRGLPAIHNDPFDRLLVAQAVCERATVVSADPVFTRTRSHGSGSPPRRRESSQGVGPAACVREAGGPSRQLRGEFGSVPH